LASVSASRSFRSVTLAALIATLVTALGVAPQPVAAAAIPDTAPSTPTAVYFPQTGHGVAGAFLEYWKSNGGLERFGFPVTEEGSMRVGDANRTVQYFERARFEYHPEKVGTPYEVLLGQLGRELTKGRTDATFRTVPEGERTRLNDDGAMWFRETQHTLGNGFRLYWQANGGLSLYGFPISREFTERNADDGKMYTVQYFERARFEWHPELRDQPVAIGLLGKADAARAKANTAPRTRGNLAEWTPIMFEKNILVDLSEQRLSARVGTTVVYSALISSGKTNTPTPPGEYRIYTKLEKDDMTGGRASDGDYYYLKDVPNVMYFLSGGYAIHGTFWHTNFGNVMSRGCVNLSPNGSKMLYDWAPLGTRVIVQE